MSSHLYSLLYILKKPEAADIFMIFVCKTGICLTRFRIYCLHDKVNIDPVCVIGHGFCDKN